MDIKQSYYELYGNSEQTDLCYQQLLDLIEKAEMERPVWLKQQDRQGNDWYRSEKMVGMMLYVDHFSKDLYGFEEKIDYLAELGITYVHFMPLLKSRQGNNDGGYAVADYLEVEPRLGTMKQLEKVVPGREMTGIVPKKWWE